MGLERAKGWEDEGWVKGNKEISVRNDGGRCIFFGARWPPSMATEADTDDATSDFLHQSGLLYAYDELLMSLVEKGCATESHPRAM